MLNKCVESEFKLKLNLISNSEVTDDFNPIRKTMSSKIQIVSHSKKKNQLIEISTFFCVMCSVVLFCKTIKIEMFTSWILSCWNSLPNIMMYQYDGVIPARLDSIRILSPSHFFRIHYLME